MKTRDVYLINGQTLKDADTVTYDLTKNLKILFLIVKYSNTNGATSNTLGRLNSMISKLAVLDGSAVLHSLSMREEQAKNFLDYRKLPYQSLTQAGGGKVTEEAIIDFRRHPGDKNFYLDTSMYSNPQLQLTHNFTISATAGFATGDGKLTVIARVVDSGAEARNGFVLSKELDSFASSASGDHTTDLPLDFPIAAIMVQNPVNAKTPSDTLSNFKLTADTDAFIPIDMSYADLLARNIDELGEGSQYDEQTSGLAGTEDADLYYNAKANIEDAANATGYVGAASGNEFAWTAATAEIIGLRTKGSAPHSSAFYRFGDGVDPADIFNPTNIGKFQLKLTNVATGATPKVVTIQQHP